MKLLDEALVWKIKGDGEKYYVAHRPEDESLRTGNYCLKGVPSEYRK